MLNMQELVVIFLTEGRELTDYIEQTLLRLEQSPEQIDQEQINALFRAAHTIKGSAGVVGLDAVVAFTHLVETAFECVRAGEVKLELPLINNLLRCNDHINGLFEFAEQQQDVPVQFASKGQILLQELSALVQPESSAPVNTHQQNSVEPYSNKSDKHWHVFIQFAADTFRDGFDPIAIVRFLASQGEVLAEHWHSEEVPSLTEIETAACLETCYLQLDLVLANLSEQQLAEAFEYIRQESLVTIFSALASVEDYQKVLQQLPESQAEKVKSRWQNLLLWPQNNAEVAASVAEAEQVTAIVETSDTVTEPTAPKTRGPAKDLRLMRVPAFRLDELVNQLGELVIATAALQSQVQGNPNTKLTESVEHIQQLVDELQGCALQLRMVQIGETFNRFSRVVRDLASDLGKDIKLEIQGAETELDKSMVERISDPLMHLVRNAIDHGLEFPEERLTVGKAVQGKLQLSAYHDSGSIVIEIQDDGRGINRTKVREKAIAKGLISKNAELTDNEIDELIFAAGFSTADAVSNLSGRGVGMDVVRKNIEALRGTVHIHSVPGKGTAFQLRLPLTLAIIDGFMVRVAKSIFVIPLNLVTECLELPDELDRGQPAAFMSLRGEMLPFIFLNKVFHLAKEPATRRSIIVVRYGQHRAGLVVDQVLGEFQTVIKPLGKLFEFMQGVSGSSILGSGDIALILDIPKLISKHTEKQSVLKSHVEVTK